MLPLLCACYSFCSTAMEVVPSERIGSQAWEDKWLNTKLPPTFVIDFVGHNNKKINQLSPILRKCSSTRSTNITMGGAVTSYFSYLQKIDPLSATQNFEATRALNITSNIVHSSYQGIIPALQYTLNQPQDHKKISALILSNPMLSDNNAIYHSVTQAMPLSCAMPGGSIVLPALVKLLLFKYTKPSDQPIVNIKNILSMPNYPVVIITHHDQTFPLQDAQALYARLKIINIPHVYLVQNEANDINLINQNIDDILRHHNLPADSDDIVDTDDYQPDVKKEWIDYYRSTKKAETLRKYFDRIVKTGLLAACIWLMYKAGTHVYHDLYTQPV